MIDQPLIDAIKQILDEAPEGLTEREIRRMVLERKGLRRRPSEVHEALDRNKQLFVPLADGIWRLRAAVEAEATTVGTQNLPAVERMVVRPYLADLPALDAYIVFDLETTGLNVQRDRIFQIAAVRIIRGAPASVMLDDGSSFPALFNSYVSLEGTELPYGLSVKLGLASNPSWAVALEQADSLATVLRRFRQWAGDLPLVAHNARFDHAFLCRAAQHIGWNIENPLIDTLELACLARPDLNSFRLEALSQAVGVAPGQEGGGCVEQWAAEHGVDVFAWTGFHNAVIDVLILAAVLPRLITTIQQRMSEHPGLAYAFHRLLPQAATRLNIIPATPDEEPDVLVKGLVHPRATPEERQPRVLLRFTPAAIRQQFQEMAAAHGLKRREAQLRMVEAVSEGLSADRFMAIEAPTGTGKTFAYLVPSVLWARSQLDPVVIATYTRLLQDQMLEDLDRVRARVGMPFHAQILKGMNNYVCVDRVAAIYAQTDLDMLDEEERFAWLCMFCWLSATHEGLLDELSPWASSTFSALAVLRDSLRAERGECSQERCASCAVCFHRLAYERARHADVVVMNHALLLSKEWDENNLPFTRVVVDEAHNLEDAATDAATDEVSWESIAYLVNRLFDPRLGQGTLIRLREQIRAADGQALIAVALYKRNALAALTDDFGAQLKRYVELNRTQVDPRYGATLVLEADPQQANPTSWRPTQEARERLTSAIRDTARIVSQLLTWLGDHPLARFHQEAVNELRYLADNLGEQAELLEHLLRVGYDRLVKVHWLEVERAIPFEASEEAKPYDGPYRWAVKCAPVRIGPYLADQLYAGKRTIVLTSATLRTTQDAGFGFVLDRLGLLERVRPEDAIALPPELDYSRALFAIARYMRFDARPSELQNFVDEVGQELGWFFRFTGGSGLGLFTARVRMLDVFRAVEPVLGKHAIPVACQGATGGRHALLEELKTRPGAVLLGLKSFWEGVDVPGSNLSYVVMEKLPFPMLGEPIVRARAAQIRARGGHEFVGYLLPLMLIDFKQGFGRLIRDEADIGAVLLLDKRVWNREYRHDLLAALPGMDTIAETSKMPVVLDDTTLLSRRSVYQAIAAHMAKAPPEWRVDIARLEAMLAEVPEELRTSLEQLLAELQVPDVTPPERLHEIWINVCRGLAELFQFPGWQTPEQELVVQALLTGRDALVVLPTGSGKSLTFQLPALLRNGTTLVFSPLKALMKDQVDKLLNRGLAVADRVDSTQTAEEQERVYQRMREGSTRLVYIAPERVRDPKLIAALRAAKNIVQVVVDEAHCVHMWGHSFRPDFLYIARLVDTIAEAQGRRPPLAALTATATPRVRTSIAQRLELQPGYALIDRNPNRPELRFVVYNHASPGFQIRSKRDKLRILLRILRTADCNDENAIVYVSTTSEAEQLARHLEINGLDVRYYHGKMDDQARKDVQDMFLDGQIKIIVATKAFGMGIDKSDIRYVIHYQLPGDIESYVQEAGRAGRDGHISHCVLLYHEDDLWIHEQYFIPNSLPEPEQLNDVLNWLRRHWEAVGWSALAVDPREMADALGFDEDRELGIHLHFLEELDFICRGVDVTLKASVRLLVPVEDVALRVREISSDTLAEMVIRLLTAQGINQLTRGELRVVDGAMAAGVDPAVLDDILYQLALSGQLIYRAFARAFTLLPGTKAMTDAAVDCDTDLIRQVRAEMGRNLASMRRYAEALRVGDCLRQETLRYLGAEKPDTRADACCSLCDVNLAVPWAAEPLWEDLTDPERYQDVKYVTLKAVGWNEELRQSRNRMPYGAWTLAQILAGNDYMATKHENDPARRRARRQLIMASQHFGVLKGLPQGATAVLALIKNLCDEGYITEMEQQWERGTYTYPTPTQLGWERLRTGQFFA